MPKNYEYVRPLKSLPGRKRKRPTGAIFLLAFLMIAFFSAYRYLVVIPKEKELETNRKISYLLLETASSIQNLVKFAYEGPKADPLKKEVLEKSLKIRMEISARISEKPNPSQLKSLIEMLELNSSVNLCLSANFSEDIARILIPKIVKKFESTRKTVLLMKLDEMTRRKLTELKISFDPAKVYRQKEQVVLSSKRRGLGIVSYSTKPRFAGKNENGIFVLEETEILDLNLEVQNQGEIPEKDVKVSLMLESPGNMEPIFYEKVLKEIKPLERKPVSFTALPLTLPAGSVYRITVNVGPVPSEAVKENNVLVLEFSVAP